MGVRQDERVYQVEAVDGVSLSVFCRAVPHSRSTVVFLHGLAGDKDEVGHIITRTADELPSLGMDTLRFDFRGHGEHSGASRGMTLAGEVNDLHAVLSAAPQFCSPVTMFVAASMGAVPLMLHTNRLASQPRSVVLWNPVLDHFRTFVDPGTPWSRDAFAPFLRGDNEADLGGFVVGRGFWSDLNDEAAARQAWNAAATFSGPGLIIHGDQDQVVPYCYAKELATENERWSLSTYEGARHGLDGYHDRLIHETVSWLSEHR